MPVSWGSRIERFKQGKTLRRKTPREAHAELAGSPSRNVVAILAESDPDRVPELVPERYARMSLNPFAFLRGAAAVMATPGVDFTVDLKRLAASVAVAAL